MVGRDLPRMNSPCPPVAACPGSRHARGVWHTGCCPDLRTRGCWCLPGGGCLHGGVGFTAHGVGCVANHLCAASLKRSFLNLAPSLFQEAREIMNELCRGTCRESEETVGV